MKPIQVNYRRIINLGNFENEQIELLIALEDGDTPESALAAARAFVAGQTQPGEPPPPPPEAPPPGEIPYGEPGTSGDPEWAALDRNLAPTPPPPTRHPHDGTITDRQLKAVYAIGRSVAHLSEAEVIAECRRLYGCAPADLSRAEASQLIDVLKGAAAGAG